MIAKIEAKRSTESEIPAIFLAPVTLVVLSMGPTVVYIRNI
jgi:hypothetical protein